MSFVSVLKKLNEDAMSDIEQLLIEANEQLNNSKITRMSGDDLIRENLRLIEEMENESQKNVLTA